ncbi:hypothetical protein OIO90_003783 [Microbotryomycetes sp. JL221]|nr:hypothetical protein OIO90_003783 [Microbotryomycetes sp. JL221]
MSILKGAVGIITGAGTRQGLGRSAVLAMAQSGAKAIYACDRRFFDFDQLQQDVSQYHAGTKLIPVELDVTDEQGTVGLCKRIIKEQKRLDFWCANAGVVDMKGLWHTESGDFRRAYDVMTLGPFYAVKYGPSAMSVVSEDKPVAKGSIVITGSIATVTGGVASIAYTAAKHAAAGIARRAAVELAKTQIRVNVVAPGLVATQLWHNSQQLASDTFPSGMSEADTSPTASQRAQEAEKVNYLSQISSPNDIANVMAFLASDQSTAINAQVIVADRGALEQGASEWSSTATTHGIQLPPSL